MHCRSEEKKNFTLRLEENFEYIISGNYTFAGKNRGNLYLWVWIVRP